MEKNVILNEYQTPIEDLMLEQLPQEIQEQFWDFFYNVPFIQNLVSKDRPRAKDLPRDDKGRIIIDVTKPHILEDMDYFRPAAIYYQQHGCYTKLRPNSNPNSEFGKWLMEEIRRCREGYVRESDGEWVPGDYYYFLNYAPMQLVKKKDKHDKKGQRVFDFPAVWEGHYLKYHAIYQARENGHHYAELASRSKGKSYTAAAMLASRFTLGESKENNKKVTCYVTADEKKYLVAGDQTLDKFQFDIDWMADNMETPSLRLISSLTNMQWVMGYKDTDSGINKGTLNSVIGVTSKDDPSKLRGSRGVLYVVEEFGCHIKGTEVLMYDNTFKKVEDIKIGDFLKGPDGNFRKVEKLYSGVDDMFKITLSNGDWQIVNSTHPVRYLKHDWYSNKDIEVLNTAPELLLKQEASKSILKGCYIEKAKIQYPYVEVPVNPYFLGLWLGDGDSTRASIANKDIEVLEWLQDNYNGYIRDLKQSKTCKVYAISNKEDVYKQLCLLNLIDNKHIPDLYIYNDAEVGKQLLAGLIDTDGNYYHNKHANYFEITQKYCRKQIIDAAKAIATNLGLRCTISTRITNENSKKSSVLHYRLRISGDIDIIPTKIARKQAKPQNKYKQRRNSSLYTFKVEPYGRNYFYGFTLNKDHLFVLKDGSIVHNTFPALLQLYNNLRPSVEEGEDVFGLIMMYGTAGDSESDFSSAQELVYNPEGYNIQAFDNVYDKEGYGKRKFAYFFPGYLNLANCYDSNGNSDITKALLTILKDRYTVKYHTTDINSITKRIAEIPITPQEAMLRTRGNIFPVTQLNDRLNDLDNNPNSFDSVHVGRLVERNGKVEFEPTHDTPIRDFPLKDNNNPGAIEIFEMPEVDNHGRVFPNRYIVGHDPVDADNAETLSLSSTFVLDLYTDRIVAEFTGRREYADDNFEIVRLLCLFYNAKCLYENNKRGIFAYFSTRRCLHLLADTPEYLIDKQLIKFRGYGNGAKGVSATTPINNYADMLIREWLIKPVVITVMNDATGELEERTVPNLVFIMSRALIKELIMYNPEINVDRVRALGMLMLYRGQYVDLYEGDLSRTVKQEEKLEDDYFKQYDTMIEKFENR